MLERYLGIKYYSPQFVVIPQTKDIAIPELLISDASPNTYRNVHGAFINDQNYKDFHRLHDIGDMFAKGYFVHTFHRLVPWQQYFSAKFEYFALRNGISMIDQLCLSNEEVFNLVVSKLTSEMQMQTEKKCGRSARMTTTPIASAKTAPELSKKKKVHRAPRFVL